LFVAAAAGTVRGSGGVAVCQMKFAGAAA